jgi:uncharacterized protein YndB with AHSA1/START domain
MKPGTAAVNVTTPTNREVVVTRAFDAPRRLVWDAWTGPEQLPRWMLGPPGWTMPVCELDLRRGGKWRFVWRRPGRPDMTLHGEYREVSPPERLVFTENWGDDWPELVNTLVLSEKDGKTTATLTILFPSREARDAALKTGMNEGMARSYELLDEHLARLERGAA